MEGKGNGGSSRFKVKTLVSVISIWRWQHKCLYSTQGKGKVPLVHKSRDINEEEGGLLLQVLSWGRGASGQLGGGIEEIRIYPAPVANLLLPNNNNNNSSFSLSPTPGRILLNDDDKAQTKLQVGISCGFFHSALLVDGNLWVWGKGDGGRLGLGHENPMFLPTLNPFFSSSTLRSVALGALHSVALNSLGQLYTWGFGGFGALGHSVYHMELSPRLVQASWGAARIRNIATSGTHTAAITASGQLYTWGRDEGDGRLGLGPGRGPNEGGGLGIPSKVTALPGPIAAVCCGGFFTMVITENGQLWNWGANSNYELGRGNKVGGWEPKPIPRLEDVHIIQIASGGYHSLALTDEGKVLSWGHGGHGQLGHSSIQSQKIPTVIEALADDRIVYIACGGSSSAAITDKGRLYMCGNARDSQLGIFLGYLLMNDKSS